MSQDHHDHPHHHNDDDHDHDHSHLSEVDVRVQALQSLLVEKKATWIRRRWM